MIENWKLYLNKGDVSKLYYNGHTQASIEAFKNYAYDLAMSEDYRRKREGAVLYAINNYVKGACSFKFQCKCNSITRLEFAFDIRRKNIIHVIYSDEHKGDTKDLVLYPNTFTYRGLFCLMQGFAEYMNEYYGNPLDMCLKSYLHRVGVKVDEVK